MIREMNKLDHCKTSLEVNQHIMTKHGWEYYLEKPEDQESRNIRFGLVMGFETEMGYVNTDELDPYIMSIATDGALMEIMPAEGWEWS